MTIQFPPAPTYADPVLADELTGKSRFNPLWLKWFLDLTQLLTAAGGGGGSFDHNTLANLQGGTANEYYHLTAAQHTAITGAQSANTVYAGPTTGAAAAPTFRGLVNADLPTNILAAGTLGSVGNFAVNTNKFTVAASTGNTAIAGTLNVTGATILAITGNGIGGTGQTNVGLYLKENATVASSAGSTFGIRSLLLSDSSATSQKAFDGGIYTPDSSFTLADAYVYATNTGSKGAASTITNWYGFYAVNINVATNTYGFYSNMSASGGGTKWAYFHTGTAPSAFNGNVRVGGTTAPTVALDVTGAALISSTLGVTGATTLSSTLAVNGDTLSTTQTTFNLVNTTATTVNFAGGATAGLNIGNTSGSTVLKGVTISLTPSNVPALIIGSSGGGSDATWLAIQSNATGGPPLLYAAGSDTDIDLRLRPKGTGYVQFGGYNAATTETFSGFITMKDDGGTLRKMMICA